MATQKEINHDILYPIHYEHVIYAGAGGHRQNVQGPL